MSIDLFQQKFTNFFSSSKNAYQFLTSKLELRDLKWPLPDQIKTIIYHGKAFYPEVRAVGRLLGLAAAPPPPHTILEKLFTTLQEMQQHGELVGFSLAGGAPKILLILNAEKLSDEQILGRFILIRDVAQKFRDFALPPDFGLGLLNMKPRGTKCETECYVFVLFSSHEKARHFTENLQQKCKHNPVFSKAAHVLPCAVDLERKRVKQYSSFLGTNHRREEFFEKVFFD